MNHMVAVPPMPLELSKVGTKWDQGETSLAGLTDNRAMSQACARRGIQPDSL